MDNGESPTAPAVPQAESEPFRERSLIQENAMHEHTHEEVSEPMTTEPGPAGETSLEEIIGELQPGRAG